MSQRFSDGVRNSLQSASQEATKIGHAGLAPAHILLGLILEGTPVYAKTLSITMSSAVDRVRSHLKQNVTSVALDPGATQSQAGILPLSNDAKSVLSKSKEIAASLDRDHIDVDHLLSALLMIGHANPEILALDALGISSEEVLEDISGNLAVHDRIKLTQIAAKHGIEICRKGPLLDEQQTPTLYQFGCDLTALAESGQIYAVVGRETEIQRVLTVLCRRAHNSCLLVGEPGVGRRTVVEAIANRVVWGRYEVTGTPGMRIIALDTLAFMAVSRDMQQLEERVKSIIHEARPLNVVLFIEDLHLIVSALKTEKRFAGVDLLGLSLSRGELCCIGTTTPEHYQRHIADDPLLARELQVVALNSLSAHETMHLLRGYRDRDEAYHRLQINDDAIDAIVRYTDMFMTDRVFPKKAFDVMDEAAAFERLTFTLGQPPEMKKIYEEIEHLDRDKEDAVANQDFERAAALRDAADMIKKKKQHITRQWREERRNEHPVVDKESVVRVLSRQLGIAEADILNEDTSSLPKWAGVGHENIPEFERSQCRSILRSQGIKIEPNTAVVFMPYEPQFKQLVKDVIRPALDDHGIAMRLASDELTPRPILSVVWNCIRTSEVIIADATGKNENVMFELGLCFALHRFPIILARNQKDLPVNLMALKTVEYRFSKQGRKRLRKTLSDTIRAFLAEARSSQSEI